MQANGVGEKEGSLDSKAGWILVQVLRNLASENAGPCFPCREKDMMILQSNLYITVTLGKWQGDRYIQGDRCTQVSFKLSWKSNNHSIYVLLTKTSNRNATNTIKRLKPKQKDKPNVGKLS